MKTPVFFFAHRDLGILITSFVSVVMQCVYSVRRTKE